MAKEKKSTLSSKNLYRPQIWSVDDAWFEGGLDSVPSIDSYLNLEDIHTVESLVTTIEKLEKHVAEVGSGWPAAEADMQYLKQLATICQKHDFSLLLCNFEYFDTHFNSANVQRSAILLDVNYYQGTLYETQGYGAHLLAEKLSGLRPRADIFFVTAEPETLRNLTSSKAGNAKWWPVRTVPFVNKGDRLDAELQAFADYFEQGLRREPLKEFAQALLRAQTEGFSHPETFDLTKKKNRCVPEDFLLRESFFPYQDLEIESVKALYDYPSGTINGEGTRRISVKIFAEHLRLGNIKVVQSGDSKFRLPVQPGILFIMHLVKFFQDWDADEIELSVNNQGTTGEASINIPVQRPEVLEEALFTGGGKSTESLRGLLACKKDIFIDVLPEGIEQASKWTKPEPISSSRTKVYRRVVQQSFTTNAIKLSWTYLP